jgi:short-chain fatty acids transporter
MDRFGLAIATAFRRVVPDPFVIAIVLTLGTMAAVLVWGDLPETDNRFSGMIRAWGSGKGLWALLAFAMQMSLILLGGHVLAETRLVRGCLRTLADVPRTAAGAATMVAATAVTLGLLNWGLALVAGALLARETGRSLMRRGVQAHYPLLAAAGYMGLLVWHGGFSGSAPLAMTSAAGAAKAMPNSPDLIAQIGVLPLDQTILSPLNLVISGGLLVLLPLLFFILSPRGVSPVAEASAFLPEQATAHEAPPESKTVVDRLNNGWLASRCLGVLMLVAAVVMISDSGIGRLGLNQVIMLLLGLGLVLHRSPAHFTHAAGQAAAGCAGIIVQFPLYAGIMGLLIVSGLAVSMTDALVHLASPETLPLATMVSAGVVNMLVPSGGGQWAVQGPIALQAGLDAGVAPGSMLMSVAYGDELTNMLQPFWALPLLAITGVRARDIVGYTCIAMLLAGAWMATWLVVLA